MQPNTQTKIQSTFREDVYKGFTDYPKHLSSKYFYDQQGDRLFQRIMDMPGYYLTGCEYDILEQNKEAICREFMADGSPFNLIELGAGDGKKTKILLKYLRENEIRFSYRPVDISGNALRLLQESVTQELPGLDIQPVEGTYFEALEQLNDIQQERKVILFLGSNIGNLLHPQAIEFLKNLKRQMQAQDLLFIGFDQKKEPQLIMNAYNDAEGITAAFNKNLLLRINRELGGNFNADNFLHWEVYDPETGTAKSYLVAKKAHEVCIADLDLNVSFRAWETIHTEISQKYDDATVGWLAEQAGIRSVRQYSDAGNYYKNYIFRTKE